MDLLDRFVAKYTVEDSGCWIWHAGTSRGGYGKFWDPRRYGHMAAHRFSYETAVGPIPDGLQIDHLCRVRACVNPDHLEPVTQRENILRGDTLATAKFYQKRCIHGHRFNTQNTYTRPNGTRGCRPCRAKRQREYLRRKNTQ